MRQLHRVFLILAWLGIVQLPLGTAATAARVSGLYVGMPLSEAISAMHDKSFEPIEDNSVAVQREITFYSSESSVPGPTIKVKSNLVSEITGYDCVSEAGTLRSLDHITLNELEAVLGRADQKQETTTVYGKDSQVTRVTLTFESSDIEVCLIKLSKDYSIEYFATPCR